MPEPSLSDKISEKAKRALNRARRPIAPDAPPAAKPGPTPTIVQAAPAPVPDDPRRDIRFAKWYGRLTRILLDAKPPSVDEASSDDEFDLDLAREAVLVAERAKGYAVFGDLVSSGADRDLAVASTVRALCEANLRHDARAFALGMADPADPESARLGLGQVLYSMAEYHPGWERMRTIPVVELARLAPIEAVTCALATGTPESVAAALEIGALNSSYDVHTLVELSGRFLSTGHRDLALELFVKADAQDHSDVRARTLEALENLRQWAEPKPTPVLEPGTISVGVMDYHQPDVDRASRNVGDYIQTLAMLGNLARFQQTRFHGDDGLGDLMTDLQARVKPELRVDGGAADVHLMPVSRDFSSGDNVPDSTWMLAFGWQMHSTYRLGFGLPYDERINPIFLSFHINRVAVLTPEAIDYLKARGPIGCRDWTTVDLLLSAGVDAFFTGCLTTTVNAVFADLADVERDKPGVVGTIDVPEWVVKRIKKPTASISHGGAEYRSADLVTGVRSAVSLLEDYQKRFTRIVTSRLHAYLPATSLGLKVKFRPATLSDVRFEGLLGMEPESPAFVAIRDGLRGLINETFALVFAGAGPDEVYAHWRELCAPLVAEARTRFEAPSVLEPAHFDLPAALAEIERSQRRYGPHESIDEARITDVALSLDQNFKGLLPVTVESIVTNATGPVRLWVTSRGLDADYEAWFARSFPDLPVTFFSFDHVSYGEITRMISHISVACMDRLLLPEVLTHLDRVTYIDIDTVTQGDVCELARTDLEGFPLAARTGIQTAAFQWRLAGNRLEPDVATDLRRTLSAAHPFDFTMFNAGVLVLDLARMREDHFVERFLPMAGTYGLNDQDILNAYAGAGRKVLHPTWNAFPLLEQIGDGGIVHYAGAGKPWDRQLVPYGERWQRQAAAFAARTGGSAQ
ncbi:glycosyltransferase [Nocardioides sp.]|uniref:glycosyltransferase n=1 Tax=Nocardioides sp. TaxID=35761 RepID=UPI003D13C9D1